MEYPSINVASYIINICRKSNIVYNNTKVQKLLYCCYGCVLAIYNKRLCDEYPRAWQYGPVFPKVFAHINKGKAIIDICPKLDADDELLELLEEIVRKFGSFSASALSDWTHSKGSPWDVVINEIVAPNSIIPDNLILDYFKKNVIAS